MSTKGPCGLGLQLLLLCMLISAEVHAQPELEVIQNENASVTLAWPGGGADDALETTVTLGIGAVWLPVSTSPDVADGRFTVSLPAADQTRFFRLRRAVDAQLTTLIETSPAPGEGGVAVTRETIFRFSAALAPDVTLTGDECFAEFGGRKWLARAELAFDRKTATLFYLENLPANAQVRVTLDASKLRDLSGKLLDADGDGRPGGRRVLEFNTAGITGLANTAVIGKVLASERNADGSNQPLANVTVTVDGAEESLRTTTDATGAFRLQPAPSGRFFVHVDGRTAVGSAWPNGAYYPFVGKAWEAVGGRTNNLAGGSGEIFLPRIQQDALRPVSATADTRITFGQSVLSANPELAGVEIHVPANSLFSDNGTRGGKVGIAPVPADRLPEPLPPGLNFPLVITVQTDGPSNFDRPVPVKFPNLPNPVTGLRLGPGEKSVLWSFNHDTGRWEIQGTMTISADGLFAVSDPGVGIRQPGWHSAEGGCPGFGPAPPPPPPCVGADCECTQTIVCKVKKPGLNTEECILTCLGNVLRNGTGGQAFQQGMECIGRSADCRDSLDTRRRMCMDRCLQPLVDTKIYIMPCEGYVHPCPAEQGLARHNLRASSGVIDPSAVLTDRLEEQIAFWDVENEFFVRLTGTSKILENDEADVPRVLAMFDALALRTLPESPSGVHLSGTERDEMLALPRPAQFSAAEWAAMIDRLDSLQGQALPPEVAIAEQRLFNLVEELKRRGWTHRQYGLLEGLVNLFRALAPAVGSPDFPARSHYFRLDNYRTGFVQRGRLTQSGQFQNLILDPQSYYSVTYLDPVTLRAGGAIFRTGPSGSSVTVPTASLLDAHSPLSDTDGDGLPDVREEIVGTAPDRADTDGDGLPDPQEIQSVTNPLDGQPAAQGVIFAVDTPGLAVDVCAWNNLAAVADSNMGVVLFDVLNPRAPLLLGRSAVSGNAVAVAGSGSMLAVAAEAGGVAVFDVSNRGVPVLVSQRSLGTSVRAVTIVNGLILAGLNAGELVLLNEFADVLQRSTIGADPVQDVTVSDGIVYVLTIHKASQMGKVQAFVIQDQAIIPRGEVSSPGAISSAANPRRMRLSSDGRHLFAAHIQGYNVIALADPLAPVLVKQVVTSQFGWKQMISDGSGLGSAAVGANSTDDGAHNVSLYDLGGSRTGTNFLATFVTPGLAAALSIQRGVALVADGAQGLVVVEYANADTAQQPPTAVLTGPAAQTSGGAFRLKANAQDDVRVRNVEFLLDGSLVADDGNAPFEVELAAPALSATKTNMVLQARVYDTAGAFSLSPGVEIPLVPDSIPPLVSVAPTNHSVIPPLGFNRIMLSFSESMKPSSVDAASIQLFLIRNGATSGLPATFSLEANRRRAIVDFPAQEDSTESRQLLLRIPQTLEDAAGNAMAEALQIEYGLTPANTLSGGTVWNVAGNWLAGLPGAATPVLLGAAGTPREIQLNPPMIGRAFSLAAHDHLTLNTGLNVAQDAVFDGKLTFVGQSSLSAGRDVLLRGGVEASGAIGGATLTAAIVRNFGAFLMNKDSSSSPFQIGGATVFRNEPGALFDLRAGEVRILEGGRIENHGTFMHSGAAPAVLVSPSLRNFGRVEVNSGTLELLGGSENYGVSAVAEGATLVFGNGSVHGLPRDGIRHTFTASSRMEGAGKLMVREAEVRFLGPVDFAGPIQFHASRGSIVFGGVTRLRGPLDMSGEFVNPFAGSRHGNDATFSGLSAQFEEPVTMGTNSTLSFNQSIPATVPGLFAQEGSRIGGRGAVTVTGASTLRGVNFVDAGLVRFDGPVEVSNLSANGPAAPSAPKVIEFNGPARFGHPALTRDTHRFTQTLLRVQTNGVLDFVRGGGFAYGSTTVGSLLFENFGVVRHSASNRTSLDLRFGTRNGLNVVSAIGPMTNWGTLEIPAGELVLPALVQKAGLTMIQGGHLNLGTAVQSVATIEGGVFRLESGQFTGALAYFGGQLELPAGTTLTGQLRVYGGTLDLALSALTVPGILQTNGTLRLNGGTLTVAGAYDLRAPGSLAGYGTIRGGGVAGGVVSPGSPLGVLTVTGNHNQQSGSKLVIEIGGLTPGVEFDRLQVNGLTIGSNAALDIRLVNGFSPELGTEFQIVTKTGTGTPRAFAAVTGLDIGGGKRFETVYDATGVKLRVVAAP